LADVKFEYQIAIQSYSDGLIEPFYYASQTQNTTFEEPPRAKTPSKSNDRTTQLIADFRNLELLNYTLFQPEPVNDFVARQRKRPAKTSTSGSIVRIVFKDNPIKELRIPVFIDDYNHNIGAVNIANQLREAYETHRATRRN
jgi:hypothetical protein